MFPSLWLSVGLAPGLALCVLPKIAWEHLWMLTNNQFLKLDILLPFIVLYFIQQ